MTAIVRGKMCELMARSRGIRDTGPYFTVGLFSVLDALMDQPMEVVLRELPLADALNAALLTHAGELGIALERVICYERADCETLDRQGYTDTCREAYLSAIGWAGDMAMILMA